MSEIRYFMPMFDRLTPRTPWTGGRIVDTDPLTLADAASMATKHAGETVSIGDFLRAAARGEITLRAIVHRTTKVEKHDGGIYCNGGQENENKVPAGAIATLPLTACMHLAGTGRASWRTFDGFEMVDDVLQRYTKARVLPDEPDFETVPDDCRVVGYDVHALADEYIADPAPAQDTAAPAPVVAVIEAMPDPERRLTLLRELGGTAKYTRCDWKFTGIKELVDHEKANGRKRRTDKTIRADLKEAAQNERDAKRAGFSDGLGKR